jgi:GNAT superfamily N-acetyltransferase
MIWTIPIAIKTNPEMPETDSSPPVFDPASAGSLQLQLIEPERLALVDRFYRSNGYKVKCGASERVYAMAEDDFIAAARLVPQSSGDFWLRNLLVASDWRGRGVASRLMSELLPDLAPQGCYCFALPHLTDFYARLGFTQNPAHCPDDIARTWQTYRNRGRDWVLMGYR